MVQTRTATLMIVSLMLSLILSGVQSSVLHPALMDHGSASMNHSSAMATHNEAAVDHHASHGMDHSGVNLSDSPLSSAHTDHQNSDDCRLKCILAMCVSGSAVLSAVEFHYPQEATVLSASVSVSLTQSQPENPFRPPISA